MKKNEKDKMRDKLSDEYYADEISNYITYRMWLEDKLIDYRTGKTKVANEGVSDKKYGIFQNVSNWLSLILLFVLVVSIIGAMVGVY